MKMDVETPVRCVLEELGGMPVREVCRRYDLSRSQYFRIRDRFLGGARAALAQARPPSRQVDARSKPAALKWAKSSRHG